MSLVCLLEIWLSLTRMEHQVCPALKVPLPRRIAFQSISQHDLRSGEGPNPYPADEVDAPKLSTYRPMNTPPGLRPLSQRLPRFMLLLMESTPRIRLQVHSTLPLLKNRQINVVILYQRLRDV